LAKPGNRLKGHPGFLERSKKTEKLDPGGIYLGTTTGQLFYSRNGGDSWELLLEHLPPINSVDCAAIV